MGTTLTGTTPKDTYDSLIKVTDNGPLSGSLKTLTDGLGNDSALALSTGGASITGTLAVSGNATFDTNTLFVDAASNEVGIGTVSPSYKLHVYNPVGTNVASTLLLENAFVGQSSTTRYKTTVGEFEVGNAISVSANSFEIYDRTNSASRLFISNAGNVGIRTSSPTSALEIGSGLDFKLSTTGSFILGSSNQAIYKSSGADAISFNANGAERFRITANGVTFNGDTAAANALDDYEEGTFTPVFRGATSAGSYTFALGGGSYTKIGNQVTVWITMIDIAQSSAGSGDWQIGGLPFTSSSSYDLARVSTACWIRSSAAARDNIICGVYNNSSNIAFLYGANGSVS